MPAKFAATPPPLPPGPSTLVVADASPARVGRDASPCANCGQTLTGPFCAHCGQHVSDFHRSVWRFVADFFDNAFCWDNKLFLTLKPLLARPGALTLDYLSGRRVRYVHPFRLFLFTSAICLTIIQYFGGPVNSAFREQGRDRSRQKTHARASLDDASPAPAPAVAEESPTTPSPAAIPLAAMTPAMASPAATPDPGELAAATPSADRKSRRRGADDDGEEEANPIKDLVDQVKHDLKQNTAQAGAPSLPASVREQEVGNWIEEVATNKLGTPEKRKQFRRDLTEGVQQKVSWVALALLPIFALMLRGLYWRRDSYYFAHFVFSLHYHTALLLFGAAYVLLQAVLPTSLGFVRDALHFCLLLPGVYLFLALRRMYAEPTKRTLAKVFVLGTLHLLVLVVGLGMVGALAAYRALG